MASGWNQQRRILLRLFWGDAGLDVGGSINAIITFYSTSMAAIRVRGRFCFKKVNRAPSAFHYLASHLMTPRQGR